MTIPPHRVPHDPDDAATGHTPMTAHKAWYGALMAALTLGLPALYLALDDGAVTGREWVAVIIAALGVPGTGGTVWQVQNRVKHRHAAR